MTPFNRALAHTLAAEGWYTDSGPTYRGDARRTLRNRYTIEQCMIMRDERGETFIQKCKVAR